jgi:hypothetical protein
MSCFNFEARLMVQHLARAYRIVLQASSSGGHAMPLTGCIMTDLVLTKKPPPHDSERLFSLHRQPRNR